MKTRLRKRLELEGVSIAGSEETENINGRTLTINDVFDDDVVFRLIGDYLWIPDLKILRQTTKSILSKVNELPKFVQNLKMTITDETLKETGLNPQSPWRNAKIIVIHTSPSSYKRIPINSLTDLHLDYPIKLNDDAENPKSSKELSASRSNCYTFLRSSIFNLKSLTLDVNLLRYEIPTNVFPGLVGTLEDLTFTGEDYEIYELPLEERRNIKTNMTMFGSLAWRLKSITVDCDFRQRSTPGLTKILLSSQNTLEKIKFTCEEAFGLLEGIHGLKFPLLKNLRFTIDEDDCTAFGPFLNLQPKLESLFIPLTGRMNPEFLKIVRRISCSKMDISQALVCNMCRRDDSNYNQFTQGLTGLRKFSIGSHYSVSYENTLTDILAYLPPTLEYLNIWKYYLPDRMAKKPRAGLMSALKGLPNLTYLKIRDCKQLFNDDVLQAICRDCTRLRSLDFSADEITDFGLTGEKRDKAGKLESSGVSLRNLKGLRGLCMVSELVNDNLSKEGIEKAIQFKELRGAELLEVPDPILLKIAANNPSLECLSRTVFGKPPNSEVTERELFSSLLSINPRLTRIYTSYKREEDGVTSSPSDYGEMCFRPSYGVPGRTLDEETISGLRFKMKISISAEEGNPSRMYYYDL